MDVFVWRWWKNECTILPNYYLSAEVRLRSNYALCVSCCASVTISTYVALLFFGNSTYSPTTFRWFVNLWTVQQHKMNWAWFRCSIQKVVLWIAREAKAVVYTKQKNAIWSSIIIYKACNSVLWQILYICLCWMMVGSIPSKIPSSSFYVWESSYYIFLECSYASCHDVLCFFYCIFCRSFYCSSCLQ